MKGFFAKIKDFSPKLKVLEILLFLKPQNRWKKSLGWKCCENNGTVVHGFYALGPSPPKSIYSKDICLLGFSYIRLPLLRERFWVPVPEVEEEWEEHQDKSMEGYSPVI